MDHFIKSVIKTLKAWMTANLNNEIKISQCMHLHCLFARPVRMQLQKSESECRDDLKKLSLLRNLAAHPQSRCSA
jgi:transcriptional regulatory protein LevR